MTALHLCAIVAIGLLAAPVPARAADPPDEIHESTEVHVFGLRGEPADSLERVGLSAYSDGVYDDAEEAFREAITARARRGDGGKKRDAALAQLHSNLAWLYADMYRYDEADSVLRIAVKLDREAQGERSEAAIARTTELAMLKQAAGRYKEAGALLDDVIALHAEKKKSDPHDVAFALHLLARNYQAIGDAKQSETFYHRVLASLDEKKTMDASLWSATMLNLAELYHASHRDGEAREAFEKAVRRANQLYRDGGLSNAVVLDPYSVLQRRAATVRAMRDSSVN